MHVLLALWLVQLLLVVFDPLSDSQEDSQPVQTVHVSRVRLGHSDEDLFRLGLAQNTGERLQKHLEGTFTKRHIHTVHHFLLVAEKEMH